MQRLKYVDPDSETTSPVNGNLKLEQFNPREKEMETSLLPSYEFLKPLKLYFEGYLCA